MTVPPVGASPPVAHVASGATHRPSFAAALDAHAHVPATDQGSPSSPVLAALAHVERAQARLDAVLQAARAGRTFTAAELIGLQAEAYRCAQTVDLASKLVEQGSHAVKQALNTQL
jgi:hypothetical protein